ncbi:undecaprenyldiphospho-muramoylpentapeptide beta-N-acetylglucosaminyltransferase [Nitrospina watsonii]|uniref:UDP-N-acetylglucosamine--N-acetylmuramyl-(pentapeptide) pyrophosphoryl-undecaprenol N-acetylglucosamine transferase n=1 Tax=Nitrospina watsonii TaxID=1323948 RepID=A0ABN8VV96_9BACT|nr:undecaprenyldiphospho-muramoylpentapeptide beta-N-acetylglucosaminyltransferase [Nitrospina watsonii]CAI2717695.1 UDP-N-acetylglucosamine--N-acetylmuramyl-(pentapeptide) pyrophosphoryl-undecaprenol N-acetylglucosamine transferase [Nitrospina watsonii]
MANYVVIAGGGTGGHLYPGIALAKALKAMDATIEITFVGTRHGIEARVLPREGLPLKTILSGGLLGKKGLGRWVSWCKLPLGLAQSLGFLMGKRPNLVVGVGGYVSGPVAVAAWLLRIPILVHEQNTVPGVTNRLIAKMADKVAVSFEESRRYFPADKVVETGNMIREEFAKEQEPEAWQPGQPFHVLVLGGSQGAQSINAAMMEALEPLQGVKDDLHIVHQTGEKDEARVRQGYEQAGFTARAEAFMYDMEEQYRKASLVICRAGATTLAEVTATGKASVLIPFPFAAHNHQEHNARVLEAAGAAEVILDRNIKGHKLAQSILDAMQHPEALQEKAMNSYRLGRRDATLRVRDVCRQLMGAAT